MHVAAPMPLYTLYLEVNWMYVTYITIDRIAAFGESLGYVRQDARPGPLCHVFDEDPDSYAYEDDAPQGFGTVA